MILIVILTFMFSVELTRMFLMWMNCCVGVNWYPKRISCLLYAKYLACLLKGQLNYYKREFKHVNSACATGVNSRKMVVIEFQRFYYLETDTDRFLKQTWVTHWWIKYTCQKPKKTQNLYKLKYLVYKRKWIGGPKMSNFFQQLRIR